ncbi:MAG: hypothetical protein Q8P22_03860 [Chloroflexota bacterium]|nr:hypothetical protein [Chloroflexota bacterium]
MAGRFRPWYVKPTVKLISFVIAAQAILLALTLGSIVGWAAIGLGMFAMLELALWADWHWPEMGG